MSKITTPNWFTKTAQNVLGVGQENQFASTRGLRYGPLRINKTGFFVNNGTLDSTIINSTGYHGYGLTGTEQLTLDATTGLNITDGTNSVFKAEISGTNIGDVTMGAYGSSAGVFYDKSAGTFTIKGAFTAGSMSIGTSPNWFSVDSSGNIWSGAATLATPAPFSVTNAGALVASNATVTGTITSISGTIGGWTLAATSLSASNVILSSAGAITVGNGDDRVVLDITSGVGYVSFYEDDSLMGRLRGTTVGTGIAVVGGDFALDNNKSFLIKGSTYYGSWGVDSSDNILMDMADADTIYFRDHAETTLGIFEYQTVDSAKHSYLNLSCFLELVTASDPGNGKVANGTLWYNGTHVMAMIGGTQTQLD